jgi:hypothetical protein
MRKSSIHIQTGRIGFLKHNSREKPTKNSIFPENGIQVDRHFEDAVKLYRQEIKKRKAIYEKTIGRKLPKTTKLHLSAIVNLNEKHTIEDVKKIAYLLEKTLGTKVFQIAVHKDEGYVDEETGKKHINYHAHIEFLGLDEEGRSVRRKLTKKYLSNLQTLVAKILNMPRGRNYIAEKAKRPIRLDTYEYKRFAKAKQEHLRQLKKYLRKHIKELTSKLENDYNNKKKLLEEEKQKLEQTLRETKEYLLEAKEIANKWKIKDEKLERYNKAFFGENGIEEQIQENFNIKL